MSAMSAPGVSDSVQAKRPWEAGYGDIDHPQIGSGSAVAQIRKPRFVDVNISAAYEHHCHNTHGRSDPDFGKHPTPSSLKNILKASRHQD